MKKLATTIAILFIIVAVFCGAMFGLNFITGPIIEANQAGAANDRLNSVMPGGQSYTDITATLTGVPSNVVKVSKENGGKGFVIECTASSDYTGSTPMDIIVGVDTTGKICGIKLVAHSESKMWSDGYLDSYLGQDSALAGVELFGGVTYSSKAFKNAVEAGMGVLISNDLIQAGVKSDAQILTEMLPTLHTGLTSGGNFKGEAVTPSGNIVEGYKALNGSGYAFIITSGEASFLAIVNASGDCKVYDVNGADVTESNVAVAEEAKAASQLKDFSTAAQNMLLAKYADASDITAIELTTFSNVVYACTFKSNGKDYTAFYSCPLTYKDNVMAICTVIDENGAIASQDVKTFLFGHGVEYLPIYKAGFGDVNSGVFKEYENKFVGITSGTLTDDVLVSTATLSSTAVKLATSEAIVAFDVVKGGQQ